MSKTLYLLNKNPFVYKQIFVFTKIVCWYFKYGKFLHDNIMEVGCEVS